MADTNNDLKERIAELELQNQRLHDALNKAAVTKIVSKPIRGTVKIDLETPAGEKIKGEYQFRDGVERTPLPTGEKVSSEALLKIANGKKLTDAEVQASPVLASVTKDAAQAHLDRLVAIGSTILQPVKK